MPLFSRVRYWISAERVGGTSCNHSPSLSFTNAWLISAIFKQNYDFVISLRSPGLLINHLNFVKKLFIIMPRNDSFKDSNNISVIHSLSPLFVHLWSWHRNYMNRSKPVLCHQNLLSIPHCCKQKSGCRKPILFTG